ncbi:hypothetical protein HZS_5796 [Henneguya salminicola]|nr:hypothetical protein HZS_5796 [Henneguya salminicola]
MLLLVSILAILGLSLSRSDTFSEATVLSFPMVDTSFSPYHKKLFEQQSKIFLTFWKNLGNRILSDPILPALGRDFDTNIKNFTTFLVESYVEKYNKSFPHFIKYFIKIFNSFGYGDALNEIKIKLAHS